MDAYEPFGHCTQSSLRDDPSTEENDPNGQATQLLTEIAPLVDEKVPAGQGEHVDAPLISE